MDQPAPSPAADDQTDELRYNFVGMLFALAIGEVASAASHVVSAAGSLAAKLPVSAHLVLATLLIATSWLGWSTSLRRRGMLTTKTPFSRDFIGLLLDVLLVVMYFILVQQAEISDDAPFALKPASAVPEATWLAWIFAVYISWDLVSDVWQEWNKFGLKSALGLIMASISCSLLCTLLTCLVLWRAYATSKNTDVVLLDCSLAAVVMLFRAIKPTAENRLRATFPSLQRYAAFRTERAADHHRYGWSLFLSVVLFSTMAATFMF